MAIIRINIDADRCAGHGRCVAQAPEVFGYDDVTNQSYVLNDADLVAHDDAIRIAVEGCPEQAILLDQVD